MQPLLSFCQGQAACSRRKAGTQQLQQLLQVWSQGRTHQVWQRPATASWPQVQCQSSTCVNHAFIQYLIRHAQYCYHNASEGVSDALKALSKWIQQHLTPHKALASKVITPPTFHFCSAACNPKHQTIKNPSIKLNDPCTYKGWTWHVWQLVDVRQAQCWHAQPESHPSSLRQRQDQ